MTAADEQQYDGLERGTHVTIYPYVVLVNQQSITLKNHIILSEFMWIHGGLKTVIGNFIHIASFTTIGGGGTCVIEDFCGVSAGSRIITGSEMVKGEGLTNPTIPSSHRAVLRSFVHLERHSFLASNVAVHPGVTIGEGAVVGSGSVVTKSLDPWGIYAGAPARRIGTRAQEKIKALEANLYQALDVTPYVPEPAERWKLEREQLPSTLL